jgi:hypothetical protein
MKIPYLGFAFAGVPLALTVIQILAVDLGTAPIGYTVWALVVPCALSMLLLEEGRKAIVRSQEDAAIASSKPQEAGAAAATR